MPNFITKAMQSFATEQFMKYLKIFIILRIMQKIFSELLKKLQNMPNFFIKALQSCNCIKFNSLWKYL